MKISFVKKMIVPCLMLFVFTVFFRPAAAADNGVVLELGSDTNPPIFYWDNVAPDDCYTQNFTIHNGTEINGYFTQLLFDFHPLTQGDAAAQSEFLNDLHLSIKDAQTGEVLFDKTADWLKNNGVSCDINIPKGSSKDFTATARLERTSTNAVQGMNVRFDIRLEMSSSDNGSFLNPQTAGRNITLVLFGFTAAICFSVFTWMLRHRRARRQMGSVPLADSEK